MSTARDDLTEHFASVLYENDNSPADWHHAKPDDRDEYLRIAATKVDAYRAEVLREGEKALREKAGQLSELAEETMRRDLEETAQIWHEAASALAQLATEEPQS